MLRTLFVAAAATAAVASPVCAKDALIMVEGRVSYSDLDLSDPAAVAEAERRIDRAAKFICTRGVDRDLHYSPDVQACREGAAANAKAKLNRLLAERS